MFCETDDDEHDELRTADDVAATSKSAAKFAESAERGGFRMVLDEDEQARLRDERLQAVQLAAAEHMLCPTPSPLLLQERGRAGEGTRGGAFDGSSSSSSNRDDTRLDVSPGSGAAGRRASRWGPPSPPPGGDDGGRRASRWAPSNPVVDDPCPNRRASRWAPSRAAMLALAEKLAALPSPPEGQVALGKVRIITEKTKRGQMGHTEGCTSWQCSIVTCVGFKSKCTGKDISHDHVLAAESDRKQRVAENDAICKALEALQAIEGGRSNLEQIFTETAQQERRRSVDLGEKNAAERDAGQAGWIFQDYQCGHPEMFPTLLTTFCVVAPNGKKASYHISMLRPVHCVRGDNLIYYQRRNKQRGFFVLDEDVQSAAMLLKPLLEPAPPSAGVGVFYAGATQRTGG